jgi:hypothetical protein
MENSKDLKDIFCRLDRTFPGEDLCSEVIGYSSEESEEEEEEIMENNPLDKIIPNHKELSREEIGKEIFKFVNKNNNDPEVIKQNEEMQHNALMKLLGIKNEAPSRPPITFRTLQKDLIDMGEKYNSESDESEEEGN